MVRWSVTFWVFALLLFCQITAEAQSVDCHWALKTSQLWAHENQPF